MKKTVPIIFISLQQMAMIINFEITRMQFNLKYHKCNTLMLWNHQQGIQSLQTHHSGAHMFMSWPKAKRVKLRNRKELKTSYVFHKTCHLNPTSQKSLPPPSKTMTDDQVLWCECELSLQLTELEHLALQLRHCLGILQTLSNTGSSYSH